MHLRLAALSAVLLLAGCITPDHQTLPPASRVASFEATAIVHCSNPYDSCWEASIAALPNGTLVAADGFAESLSISRDGGHNWTRFSGPGQPMSLGSVPGWSDTDSLVTATPDGSLVFSAIAATYNDAPAYAAGASTLLGIHVAVSKDAGKTWVSNTLLGVGDGRYTTAADRQWVAGGPHGEIYLSFAHYRGSPLFYAYAGPVVQLGAWADNVVEITRSDDAGATWSDFHDVTPEPLTCGYGGPPVVTADGAVSIPMTRLDDPTCLYDPTGTYAPPPTGMDLVVATSKDGGATFSIDTVFATSATPEMAVLFPTLAANSNGTLAAAWARADGRAAVAVRASDGKWTPPVLWTPAGGNVTVAPGLVLRGDTVVLSFMTQATDAAGRPTGVQNIAWGDANGPLGNATVSAPTYALGGANGDFANLVALPDGGYATTLAVYDPGQRAMHVQAFIVQLG